MAAALTQPMAGLGLPDTRLTSAKSTATPTAAANKPGTTIADSPTAKLDPRLSNSQDTDLALYVTKAGSPLRSPTAVRGAALIWSGDGGTIWNGWNAPTWIERMDVLTPYSSADGFTYFGAVVIPSSQKLVVCFQREGNVQVPQTRTLDPATGVWGAAVSIKTNPNIDAYSDCDLAILPNERLLFIQSFDDVSAIVGARERWNVHYSDDAGATWALASSTPFSAIGTLLGTPVVSGVSALKTQLLSDRVGNVLFFRQVNDGTGKAVQYASTNMGQNFRQVGSDWTSSAPIHINLILLYTGQMALVSREGSAVIFRAIGTVFSPLEEAAAVTIVSTAADAVAAWQEPDGVLWCTVAAAGIVRIYQSVNDGATWTEAENFPSILHRDGDASTKYRPQIAVHAVDGAWIFGNSTDAGGGTTFDGMLTACRVGGPTNVEVPPLFNNSADLGRQWLPIELPGTNSALNEVTTGGTATLTTPGMMRIDTTAQTLFWNDANPGATWGAVLHDFVGVLDIQVQSGGSTAAIQSGVVIGNGDGVNRAAAFLTFSTSGGATTYAILDSGVPLGVPVSPGITGRVQVFYYYDGLNQTFSTWWRAHSGRTWTQGHAAAVLTTAPSAATTAALWGHAASTTCQDDWYMHNYAWTTDVGTWDPPDAKADYRGKSFTGLAHPIPDIGTDARVAHLKVRGVAVLGEGYTIATASSYAVHRIYPANNPNPKAGWRSTSTAENIIATWHPNEDGVFATSIGKSVFVYLAGINFKTLILEGSNDGGSSFATIGTLDAAVATAIPYVLVGKDAIEVDSTSSGNHTRFLNEGAIVGGTIAAMNGTDFRRIRQVESGVFDADNVTKQARIWFKGVTGGENAQSTCSLWAPECVLVVHNVGAFDTIQLRIPTQTTADGDFRIGNMLVGAVRPFGRQPDWGHSVDWQPNSSSQTDRAGTTRVRRNGSVQRIMSFGWPNPVDLTEILAPNPSPDYRKADTGEPLAADHDIPFMLAGVLEYIGSGETPVVMFWDIPTTDGTLTRKELFMAAHMTTSTGAEHVVGEEASDPVYRVPRVTLAELIG
jgi:hypothetical protein